MTYSCWNIHVPIMSSLTWIRILFLISIYEIPSLMTKYVSDLGIYDTACFGHGIQSLIQDLQWTSVTIIYDTLNDSINDHKRQLIISYCDLHKLWGRSCNNSLPVAPNEGGSFMVWECFPFENKLDLLTIKGNLTECHIPYSVKQQRYSIDDIDLKSILQSIHTSMFPNINIIIAVSDVSVLKIMKEIDNYDFVSNGTDFRHHSRIFHLMRNISKLPEVEHTIQHLENVAVGFQTERFRKTSNEDMAIYTLHIHPTGRAFAFISCKENSSLLNILFPNIKYGYNSRQLLVTTLESAPYVFKNETNGTVHYTGYIIDIWKTIAKRLNFSYEVHEPEDGNWGVLENGQWNGMVGQLIKKEVDVAMADITVFHGRALFIDYVFPAFMVDTTDILYRRQPSTENTYFLLLRPLRTDVYAVFSAICVGAIIVFIVTDQQSSESAFDIRLSELRHKVFNTIWEFLASVFRQEFKIVPATSASRVLLSSWWLLVLIITSVYSANLIAALSSQTDLTKLSSIDDLVDSDYTTGAFTQGIPYETIKTSQRPELRRLYAKMLALSKGDSGIFLNDLDAHIGRVRYGKHAIIMYRSAAERFLAEDCHLALIGESVTWAEEYISFALPKGSPLKRDIDKVMYDLQESGILDVLWKKWTTGHNTTTCSVDRQVTAITMREVTGGFLVVCGAVGLSFVVLLIEMGLRFIKPELKSTNE